MRLKVLTKKILGATDYYRLVILLRKLRSPLVKFAIYTNVIVNRMTNPENCFITCCSGNTSGIGAKTQAILSTMLFAHRAKIQYVHTPFQKVAFNQENDINWENKWEKFFNLGKGELTIDEIDASNLNVVHLDNPIKLRKKKNTLYVLPHCHYYADMFANDYLELASKFVEKYESRSKGKYELHYERTKINAAVHVRRGDVSKNGADSFRYTSNQFVCLLLERILLLLSDFTNVEVSIRLYSQGEAEDFGELRKMSKHFHLNDCVFATFHNMVSADILIMSKSSFSYSAALFSNGVKIYEPFWHKPLKNWIVTNNFAEFNESDFREKVCNLLLRRGLLTPIELVGVKTKRA